MLSVVLAGGSGTGLWPESIPERSKHRCGFLGKGSWMR